MDEKQISIRERLSGSFWALWLKPAIDYITRVAELIVLSSAFQVVAARTSSVVLDGLAVLLTFACATYAGVAFGVIHILVERIKTKRSWLALVIAFPLGAAMGFLAFEGSRQLSETINQIAALETND